MHIHVFAYIRAHTRTSSHPQSNNTPTSSTSYRMCMLLIDNCRLPMMVSINPRRYPPPPALAAALLLACVYRECVCSTCVYGTCVYGTCVYGTCVYGTCVYGTCAHSECVYSRRHTRIHMVVKGCMCRMRMHGDKLVVGITHTYNTHMLTENTHIQIIYTTSYTPCQSSAAPGFAHAAA